ncbi:MAG: LysM peptidoglycan-binding domain-containing protein [Oscillospiraceae bacterium]|jgi:LysM repeat protein|nr:LysM peptidoglycan-binding domain-containing protein [Oscillospiraceae bacterium]
MDTQEEPIIKQGSTDPSVLVLQQYLKLAGLFPSTITGSFGQNTTDAVKRFQKENKLVPDGIVGPNTWNALRLISVDGGFPPAPDSRIKPILKVGDKGTYVAELQKQLQQLGYYTGAINSSFDSNTEKAVKAFQAINKLSPDGVVGNDSWGALYYLYSPLASCNGQDGGGGNDGDYTIYVVKSGDSLWAIAQRFGTTVDEIKSLNGLTSNNLSIGQELKIPGTGSGGGGGTEPDYILHVVRSGDTLWTLAQRYGTTVAAIRALNNLTSDALSIGQQIKIPSSSVRSASSATNCTFQQSGNQNYTVKSGDTLWKLAKTYGTTVSAIKSASGISSDDLSIGQHLVIPGSSGNAGSKSTTSYNTSTISQGTTSYVVKSGDTLWKLAKTYGTTVSAIKLASGITSDNLSIGQRLSIPGGSNSAAGASSRGTTSYTVKSGDSLWLISKRYGTTVDEIISHNNLTSSLLSIGQVLIIPE